MSKETPFFAKRTEDFSGVGVESTAVPYTERIENLVKLEGDTIMQ